MPESALVGKKQFLVMSASKVLQKKWVKDLETKRSVQIQRARAWAPSMLDTEPMRTRVTSDDNRCRGQDTEREPGSTVLDEEEGRTGMLADARVIQSRSLNLGVPG